MIAVLPLPYGFYMLLRLAVCGCTAYLAYYSYKVGLQGWAWALAIMAVLFNPLVPVYLFKGPWIIIDLGSAALLYFHRKASDNIVHQA
jgi:hypothetical protein